MVTNSELLISFQSAWWNTCDSCRKCGKLVPKGLQWWSSVKNGIDEVRMWECFYSSQHNDGFRWRISVHFYWQRETPVWAGVHSRLLPSVKKRNVYLHFPFRSLTMKYCNLVHKFNISKSNFKNHSDYLFFLFSQFQHIFLTKTKQKNILFAQTLIFFKNIF